MPSLEHAYLQRDWAREKIDRLEVLCRDICAVEQQAMVVDVKPETTIPAKAKELYTYIPGGTPIPPELLLLAGESIGALRSALDYLVRNLSELDTGTVPKARTQFPIESSPDGFNGKRGTFLAGVNDSHVAHIESLQPYCGCDWTKRLAKFTNIHKHNALLDVRHDLLYWATLYPIPGTDAYTVNMHFEPAIYIFVDDGFPLVETLKEIESQVSQTLDAFNPQFK